MFQSRFSRARALLAPHLPVLLLVSAAFIACGALLFGRMLFTRSANYLFLPFNLILAALPVLFSLLFVHAERLGARICLAGLWLLFFPNAPYILTDLIHLTRIGGANGAPLWFDILLVTSYAGAGLLFAYISLMRMHSSIGTNFPRLGWGIVVLSCFLAGFGIYLGRFLRWHSIHLFLDPLPLLADIVDRLINPLNHPRTWGVTLGFGMLILFGYLGLFAAATLLPRQKEIAARTQV